jgi:hypothetical protein
VIVASPDMPTDPCKLLSALSAAEEEAEAARRDYPKWSTLCLIARAGLPSLDAVLIPPEATRDLLAEACAVAVRRFGGERVLVRSDGSTEQRDYYTGGMSLPVATVVDEVTGLHAEGRAVILMEPTDRLANEIAVNVRVDRPCANALGRMVMEALGPGYDNADLNRGGIAPAITVIWDRVDFRVFERPGWFGVEVRHDDDRERAQERRRLRFGKIGAQILPRMGLVQRALDEGETIAWLQAHGYDHLWRDRDWSAMARHGMRWLADGWRLAAAHPNARWTCLSVSLSDLGDGRLVYWDVVDASAKFALRGPATAESGHRGS